MWHDDPRDRTGVQVMAVPARSPGEHAEAVEMVCAQGERAMLELSWTMANVNWREHLAALVAVAEAAEERARDATRQADEAEADVLIESDVANHYDAERRALKAERDRLTERAAELELVLDCLSRMRDERDYRLTDVGMAKFARAALSGGTAE